MSRGSSVTRSQSARITGWKCRFGVVSREWRWVNKKANDEGVKWLRIHGGWFTCCGRNVSSTHAARITDGKDCTFDPCRANNKRGKKKLWFMLYEWQMTKVQSTHGSCGINFKWGRWTSYLCGTNDGWSKCKLDSFRINPRWRNHAWFFPYEWRVGKIRMSHAVWITGKEETCTFELVQREPWMIEFPLDWVCNI